MPNIFMKSRSDVKYFFGKNPTIKFNHLETLFREGEVTVSDSNAKYTLTTEVKEGNTFTLLMWVIINVIGSVLYQNKLSTTDYLMDYRALYELISNSTKRNSRVQTLIRETIAKMLGMKFHVIREEIEIPDTSKNKHRRDSQDNTSKKLANLLFGVSGDGRKKMEGDFSLLNGESLNNKTLLVHTIPALYMLSAVSNYVTPITENDLFNHEISRQSFNDMLINFFIVADISSNGSKYSYGPARTRKYEINSLLGMIHKESTKYSRTTMYGKVESLLDYQRSIGNLEAEKTVDKHLENKYSGRNVFALTDVEISLSGVVAKNAFELEEVEQKEKDEVDNSKKADAATPEVKEKADTSLPGTEKTPIFEDKDQGITTRTEDNAENKISYTNASPYGAMNALFGKEIVPSVVINSDRDFRADLNELKDEYFKDYKEKSALKGAGEILNNAVSGYYPGTILTKAQYTHNDNLALQGRNFFSVLRYYDTDRDTNMSSNDLIQCREGIMDCFGDVFDPSNIPSDENKEAFIRQVSAARCTDKLVMKVLFNSKIDGKSPIFDEIIDYEIKAYNLDRESINISGLKQRNWTITPVLYWEAYKRCAAKSKHKIGIFEDDEKKMNKAMPSLFVRDGYDIEFALEKVFKNTYISGFVPKYFSDENANGKFIEYNK